MSYLYLFMFEMRTERNYRGAFVSDLSEFGRKLEDDLTTETSGHFKHLLVAQCNADRDESNVTDFAKADLDAKDIFEVTVIAGTVVVCWFHLPV